ncbi:hypothetical protein [Mucilaginibacter sp. FT3.2]|uniref:hypothetical protein n=1 Tax=Mucilaginibacter sp. FT3.2 TaxID=2723090 RepID=UPI001616D894|nr:hypothetical protein [Mucilaginibacter sp. FT3.2]MBB6234206.1 hypothetical protein [Mucilaginibacter sp. FT3.2]
MKNCLIIALMGIAIVMCSCNGDRTAKHVDTTTTLKAANPPPVDSVIVPPKEKVKFYDPIILESDTDFGVKLVGQHFDVRPNTPALNTILTTYLQNCYNDYHRLPSKFIIHYANERTRILTSKGVRESIVLSQESLRQYIPGADKTENIGKFPILYQTRFY